MGQTKGIQEFDPIISLEKEEYDIRRAKEMPISLLKAQQEQQVLQAQKPLIVDLKYELKALNFLSKKNQF